MKPHPGIRKTVKWGGAAVTVLLVASWIASEIYPFGWGGPPGNAVSFAGGLVLWGKAMVLENGRDWGIDSSFPLPLDLLSLAAGIPTIIAWWIDAIVRRHARLNLCPNCNYDRTGIAKDAVCPECGAAALALKPTKSARHE